ncbi:MAG: diguanylate cyclase [Acidimicrobiia bacterium]
MASVAPTRASASALPAHHERAERIFAYEYTAHDLALSAQQLVEIEAALLVHYRAFPGPVPQALADAADGLVYSIESMGPDGVRNWLDQIDFANATVLDQMRTIGAPMSRAVVAAMSRMPTEVVKALDTNGSMTIEVRAREYVEAIADLRDRDGAPGPNGVLAETPPSKPATSASAGPPGATASTSSTPRVTVPSPSTSDSDAVSKPVVVAGIAAVVLLLGAIVMSTRRRARRARRESLSVDHFVQLGRRISAATDVDAVWSSAVAEAVALAGAASGGARPMLTSAVPATSPARAPAPAQATIDASSRQEVALEALIDRVSDSGKSAMATIGDHHVLATAVTSNGSVKGVLWVIADEPFDHTIEERLGHLAPIVATALDQAHRHESLSKLTVTDALTSLANRRRLDDDLALIDRSAMTAFVMLDIDHFKAFNDAHGHPAGDALLRQVAEVLASSVRPGDVVYRYGGEEFAVLLPGASAREASSVAERLVAAVRSTMFEHGDTQPLGRVTISAGVAGEAHVDGTVLRERADQALYEAKRSGRDRVVVAPWGGPPGSG